MLIEGWKKPQQNCEYRKDEEEDGSEDYELPEDIWL